MYDFNGWCLAAVNIFAVARIPFIDSYEILEFEVLADFFFNAVKFYLLTFDRP